MRSLLTLGCLAVLGACSTAPQHQSREAEAETRLQQALAGKVAGRPVDCLPTFRTGDVVRIDDDTVLFRDGANRVYRNDLNGSCNGLGSPNYTLVTNSFGSAGQLCRGDIARMVDVSSGIPVGSCVVGKFVPYTAPRG